MKEETGSIWDYHKQGHWIIITTNGNVKTNGEAVMGKGIALQAKQRFPDLPKRLGKFLSEFNNTVHSFGIDYRIISFPTKHNWQEKSDIKLIEESCQRLKALFDYTELGYFVKEIYMPRPGCANGQLSWGDVKPVLEKYLDDRFIVVERGT